MANISAPTMEQHVRLSLSLTFMARTHWTPSDLMGGGGGASLPMTDRQSEACHTHFVSLLSPRLCFVQTGHGLPGLFCLSHHFHRDNLFWSSWTKQTAAAAAVPRVFMTCAHTHTHAHMYQGRAHTHAGARDHNSPEDRISRRQHSLFGCKLG